MAEQFTIQDLHDDFVIQNIFDDVVRKFMELDGYYELYNLGREEPISKEDWIKLNG